MPVDHPLVAVAVGLGLDQRRVGTGDLRLGHREARPGGALAAAGGTSPSARRSPSATACVGCPRRAPGRSARTGRCRPRARSSRRHDRAVRLARAAGGTYSFCSSVAQCNSVCWLPSSRRLGDSARTGRCRPWRPRPTRPPSPSDRAPSRPTPRACAATTVPSRRGPSLRSLTMPPPERAATGRPDRSPPTPDAPSSP